MIRTCNFWSRCVAAIVLLLSLFSALSNAQQAAVARQRNLVELTDEAAVIIHGRVVRAAVEPHPTLTNLTTVVVTMNVEENLKGESSKSYTFRQYVWDIRSRYSATYSKGQELLLFLRPPSRYGLTSTAGLQQGRFEIHRDPAGKASAINANANIGIFDRVKETARARRAMLPAVTEKWSQQPGTPIDLNDLKSMIRAIAGGKQ